KQGRYADAEPLYRRSLGILERNLGPDHPDMAMGHFNLAVVLREQGLPAEAYAANGRAVEVLAKRLARAQGERSERDTNERRRFRDLFLLHIALADAQAGTRAEPEAESF